MSILNTLPVWFQEIYAWITPSLSLGSLAGSIFAIIKLFSNNKISTDIAEVQNAALVSMGNTVTNVKGALDKLSDLSNLLDNALKQFDAVLLAQNQANTNLASFVMACFEKSNLSAESKAELKALSDTLFHPDLSLVDALKTANAKAVECIAEKTQEIENLEAALAEEKHKLQLAQETVRANRRV